MAKRGPKSKLRHIHLVAANPPRRADAAKSPTGAGKVKEKRRWQFHWLNAAEREVYRAYARRVKEQGLLEQTDDYALAAMAMLQVRVFEMKKFIQEYGYTYSCKTKSGGIMRRRHPEVATLEIAEKELRQRQNEFGLTPTGRTHLQTVDLQGDMWEAFLAGGAAPATPPRRGSNSE